MTLRSILAKSGAAFSVADSAAEKFQALLDDLEAAGYQIKGDQSGGYNPRNIAGTNTPSHHASGNAIDINWTDNARGSAGDIPAELARQLAAKHGLIWGGDWKNPDPMHFEVANAARVPTLPSSVAASVSTGGNMDIASILTSLFGAGGGQAPAAGGSSSGVSLPFGMKLGGNDDLAKQPMIGAQPGTSQSVLGPMQKRPVDMSMLAQILQGRMKLGV